MKLSGDTAVPSDFLYRAFAGSLDLNLRLLKEFCEVEALEVVPGKNSALRLCDDHGGPLSLHVRNDTVIGQFVLLNKHWDASKSRFVEEVLKDFDRKVCLIDVGANVGLFSRQCLARTQAIGAVFAYEPHPLNYTLLQRNLGGIARVRLCNVGLGKSAGAMPLYLDPQNTGNYSLCRSAVEAACESVKVQIAAAGDEERRWLLEDLPIFYKSDTQGFDETIATSLSADFWKSVKGGILELWRIEGKEFDAGRLVQILDGFSHKIFQSNMSLSVTSATVLKYLESVDRQFDDLLFWND